MITGRSILYFGPEQWDGLWRNRHQLMSRFAETQIFAAKGTVTPDAVDALKGALYGGSWLTPFRTRRIRVRAADALRKIGTSAAVEALRDAAAKGSRGVRAAARSALARLG